MIHWNCPSHHSFLRWGGSFVWRGADMSGCLNPDLTSTTSHTDLLISHFSYSKSTRIVKSVPQGSQMCQQSGDWGVQARRNGRPLTWIVSSYMRTRDTQHLGFFVVVGMTLAWVYHAQRIWISKCLCSALQHTWLLYSFLYNACLVVLSFSLAVPPGDKETSVPVPYFNAKLFAQLTISTCKGKKWEYQQIQPQINPQWGCQTFDAE